jgi:hypothetical protein
MKVATRYLSVREYPYEYLWDVNLNEAKLRELCDWADVLNFNDYPPSAAWGRVNFEEIIKEGKRVMVSFHGTYFRRREAVRNEMQEKGYKALVSMPCMLGYMNDDITRTEWLPYPVPTDDPKFMPLPVEDRYPYFAIAHSPGEVHRWDIKDTDAIIDAVKGHGGYIHYNPDLKQLDSDYLISSVQAMNNILQYKHMRLVLMTNAPWEDCLAMKQRCSIAFDHLQGYYGVSAAESMSMGLPTVCNLNYQTHLHSMEAYGRELPFVISDRCILPDTLSMLRGDDELRHEIGFESRDYAIKVHDLNTVVMPKYIKAVKDA